jgi:hypothetical protein
MSFAGNCTYGTPADGTAAIVALYTQLLSVGWTVTNESDGGTLGNTFNGASGSWFALKSPGGNQSWCFQADTGGNKTLWRVKYAPNTFTSGSPAAQVVPSATSEVVLFGGGTDGSPSFNQLLATDGTYRWLVACDDAAPYGWHAMAFLSGGFGGRTLVMFDPLLANSYAPADANPYVVTARYGTSDLGKLGTVTFSQPYGTFSPNSGVPTKLQSTTWVNLGYLGANLPSYGYELGNGGQIGPNIYTGFEQRVLIGYARTTEGFSGYSSLITAGTCVSSPARTTGDVLQVGTDYFVRLDYIYIPWDSTPVVI